MAMVSFSPESTATVTPVMVAASEELEEGVSEELEEGVSEEEAGVSEEEAGVSEDEVGATEDSLEGVGVGDDDDFAGCSPQAAKNSPAAASVRRMCFFIELD